MSTPLNSVVAAAKDVLGSGTMNPNVEMQLRTKFSKGGSVDEIMGALKDMLGTKKMDKTRETQVKNGATVYAKGGSPKLAPNNATLANDSIMQGAPPEGVN